jgi:ribosome-associated heat shock protein Hsp15
MAYFRPAAAGAAADRLAIRRQDSLTGVVLGLGTTLPERLARASCDRRQCAVASRDDDNDDRHRLDRWLWFARFFKTRSLATDAVASGRVKLNDARVKPAHEVRIGDRVLLVLDRDTIEIDVTGLPTRRGPAPEAQRHYTETAGSIARRAQVRENRRLSSQSHAPPDARPDKRERRQLDRLKRRQSD